MIYYVEDDDSIRELVVYTLGQMGMQAQGFASSEAFWPAMRCVRPDLILLDIMLPGEGGLQILRRLRADEQTADIPIIMLTAKGTEYDKVQGLDMGADDYIAKPFGMAELTARIRARLRRSGQKPEPPLLVFGPLSLDKRGHAVRLHGQSLTLTMKEYELLCLLMENRGQAFSREMLLERIWDWSYDGGTRTVDVHVQTLRTKMGRCGHMIETVRGVGYRFGGADA